jgi:nitrate/nitrite transporter NarK
VGLFTWPHKILDKKIIGSSIGVINTGGTLGGFIGPTLFGAVIDCVGRLLRPGLHRHGHFRSAGGVLAQFVSNARPETEKAA